jgi:hypothetical protein
MLSLISECFRCTDRYLLCRSQSIIDFRTRATRATLRSRTVRHRLGSKALPTTTISDFNVLWRSCYQSLRDIDSTHDGSRNRILGCFGTFLCVCFLWNAANSKDGFLGWPPYSTTVISDAKARSHGPFRPSLQAHLSFALRLSRLVAGSPCGQHILGSSHTAVGAT